mmetsp:Transcript_20531/g.42902  ORF Transcript_20531/g.42902 Transcript_20531/m.42902 type:complete len:279 (-) Transcript_20531:793-1629(-)
MSLSSSLSSLFLSMPWRRRSRPCWLSPKRATRRHGAASEDRLVVSERLFGLPCWCPGRAGCVCRARIPRGSRGWHWIAGLPRGLSRRCSGGLRCVVVVVVVVARRRRRRGPAISGCFRISGDSLWPGSRFPRWSCHRTRGRRASGPGWRRGSPRRPWWSEGPRTGPGCPTNRSTRERCWRTGHPGPLGGTTGRILRKTAAAVPGLSLRRRRPRAPPGPGFGGRGRGSGACSPSIAAIPRGRPVRGWTNRRCRCFRRRHRGGCRRGSSGRGPGGPPGNR